MVGHTNIGRPTRQALLKQKTWTIYNAERKIDIYVTKQTGLMQAVNYEAITSRCNNLLIVGHMTGIMHIQKHCTGTRD